MYILSYYLPVASLLRDFNNRNISGNEEANNLGVCFVSGLEFTKFKMKLRLIYLKKYMKQASL